MSVSFDPAGKVILIPVRVWGPRGDVRLRFALDTGATGTIINSELLSSLGYDPMAHADRTFITTGSGIEEAYKVVVQQLDAMGSRRKRFSVTAFNLPPTTFLDGLLGLDFLRGRRLTIDFRKGTIILR